MNYFTNFGLLAVAFTISAIGILGFTIYFNDRKSITNKSFFLFSIITVIYSILNYFRDSNFHSTSISFLLLRLTIFFATWHAFSFFRFVYVFPLREKRFHYLYKLILVPVVLFTSFLTLTPFVFKQILSISETGKIVEVENGPGIALFSLTVFLLILGGFLILGKKAYKGLPEESRQIKEIMVGAFLTFFLLIYFNIIMPVAFNDSSYVRLAALFFFPFILFTSYAIIRHRLFKLKVVGTAFLTFILTIVTFAEIIFADSTPLLIFRASIFLLVLVTGINIIRSVFKEVDQREKLEKLAHDIENSNNQLAFANMKLKELDQMKSEFLSLASHQIRGPLTAIKGYISLIQEGDYGPVSKEVNGALDVVFTSTNNLVAIVGDFLDVSRIEQGRMKFDFSDFDLEQLVEQVAQEYKPNVEKRGLKFNYIFEAGKNYMVHADMGKIKQVIGNIIDNSIKYTPTGTVSVAVSTVADKALIKIYDTGVGIPSGTIPKLFQKFTRAENANETNILGTGLGLYVAKQMVEAHHGRVWAESEGEGKGSQFYIELQTVASNTPITKTKTGSKNIL